MLDTVQEKLDWSLEKLDENLDYITKLLINNNYNRDNIRQVSQPYQYAYDVDEYLSKLKNIQNRNKYVEKYENAVKRFNIIVNVNIVTYTQFLTYNMLLILSRYNSEVELYYRMIEEDKPEWGEYSDGGFSDSALGLREYLEEVIFGIELLDHSHFYPWLPLFKEEVKRYHDYIKIIVEKVTEYYTKIDAIKIPSEYLTWFSKPYWWRELELKVYNEVKKG